MTSATLTPPRTRLTDAQIIRFVQRAADGDANAWEAIVQDFSGLIWGIARAHRLSDVDAADAAQETWLSLLDNLGNLHEPARLGAWVATVARRHCLRILRRGGRTIPSGDGLPEQVSGEPAPGEDLLTQERDSVLRESFGRLRASDQALLRVLMSDPAPSYKEVAAGLGMPIGSIGPTRGRALERLRHELDAPGTLSLLVS
jgi:RNA polymerase sigma factor (sigma-70 family)